VTLGTVVRAWERWERARDALLAIRRETARLRPEEQPTNRPQALEARAAWTEAQDCMRAYGKEHALPHFWREFPRYWQESGWELLKSSFPEVKPDGRGMNWIALRRKRRARVPRKRGRKPKQLA
jgi:hypothetical protein